MKNYLAIIFGLLLSGCISSSSVLYDESTKFPATGSQNVEIFRSDPPQEYVTIGEVTARNSNHISWLEDTLKKEAAVMGGDAVIIKNKSTVSNWRITHELDAVVIKFKNKNNELA